MKKTAKNPPLENAFKAWLSALKGSKSEKTVKKYASALKGLVERYGMYELSEIDNFVYGYGISFCDTKSKRQAFRFAYESFRKFVKTAYRIELEPLPDDFVGRIPLKRPSPLSDDEFQALLEEIRGLKDTEEEANYKNISTKLMFYLMAFGGLRSGEVLKVMPTDVRFGIYGNREYAEIRVRGKGDKERDVLIFEPEAVQYLKEHVDDFPVSLTQQAFWERLNRLFRRACQRIGKPYRKIKPHNLRDTCLTRLANKGIDIRVIQRFAGHSSITMTQRYIGLTKELYVGELSKTD